MPFAPPSPPTARQSHEAVAALGGLGTALQPLVDLADGHVLGHEALLRVAPETGYDGPLPLLEDARAGGWLTSLDLAALGTALAHVADEAGGDPVTLFVNVEPLTLTSAGDELLAVLSGRPSSVQVVVELTERALAADAAGILEGAERLRAAGCALALDDVGTDPASLAFIPLLQPEVVKLDLSLLRTLEDPETVTVANAIRAFAEATGAEVVAEGIETEADLTRALVLGATLGQGWHWGRPQATLRAHTHEPARFEAHPVAEALAASPFDLVAGSPRIRTAPKRLLLPLSRTIELDALGARVPPVLLSSFQEAHRLTPATREHYERLATTLPFVGALAMDMPATPVAGVHGGRLAPSDPLAREWTVVALGAHTSTALIARERDSDVTVDGDRPFDFAVTHDRALVTAAAQALLGRLTRVGTPPSDVLPAPRQPSVSA